MNTLAVSNETDQLCFAYFEGENLKEYGKIATESLESVYESIRAFAKDKKLAYIVVRATDLENVKRRTAIKLTRMRTILKLVCEQLGIVYATPSTNGWEKYLFGDRVQGAKLVQEKIDIVNRVYDMQLKHYKLDYVANDEGVADAIVMGSAFTLNKYKKSVEGYYGL